VAHDLRALLGSLGVTTTAQLTQRVDRQTVSSWVRAGRLLRPHRGVVVLPERWGDWPTRAVAAELATGGVLHSVSALTAWRLAPASFPIHVAVPANRRAPASPGLVVHRLRDLTSDRLGPHWVTPLPRSLCDAWGVAHAATGRRRDVEVARSAVITTLRDRRVRIVDLRREAARRPALPGRRDLLRLVDLVEDGCQSELEIWGVHEVLRGDDMPRFVQQHPVRLPHAVVRLDAAFLEVRVAVELDGAAFHGSPEARERDTRRDVALAAAGWVVLRFSYRRLTREPEACRREILAVCRQREALLLRR
jgi:very-short-patch-repair endonuclease